jgi:hypothetical protein
MAPDLQCQVVFQVSYEFTFSLLMFENSTPTDTSPALRSIHFLSTYFVILWVKLQFLLLLVNIRIKYLYHFYLFLFFFFQYWGLNSEPSNLSHFTSSIFVKGFSGQGLANYLPGLASNHDPSDRCLLSS